MWNYSSNELTVHSGIHSSRVSCLAGIAGSTFFLSGGYDKKINKLDLLTLPTIVSTFSLHTNVISAISIHGNTVYSVGNDKVIRIWDHTTTTQSQIIPATGYAHLLNVIGVIYMPELDQIVTASVDTKVKIWSKSTSLLVHEFPTTHTSDINNLYRIHNFAITCSNDLTIKTWNIKTQTLVFDVAAHTSAINQLSGESDKYISGSSDMTVKLWSLKTCTTSQYFSDASNTCQACLPQCATCLF